MKPVSAQHAAAREYAEAGLPVFPLSPNTKVPWTENGFKDETADIAQIDAWWTAEPRLNIGFRPQLAGWSVVDPDQAKGPDGKTGLENWAVLAAEHSPIHTYSVRTPHGGLHLYFEGDLPPSQGLLGKHIDTRGGGSYVLIPPSVVDGKPYVVETDMDPAPLPEWIPAAIAAAKRHDVAEAPEGFELDHPEALARARDFLRRAKPAVEGDEGDLKTFVTAAKLADLGVSEETALDLMEEFYNPRCEPPWEHDELALKVYSAYHNRENAIGAFADPRSSEEAFASYATTLGSQAEQTGGGPRFKAFSVAEMRSRPPPKWLLPNFVTERGLSLVYGPAGGYKTFMAIMRACEIAATGRPVIWIAGEGSVDVAPRIDAWRLAHNHVAELPITIFEDMPLAINEADMKQFVEDVLGQDVKADAVFIDTAATMMLGLNENDAKDAGIFIDAMKKLRNGLGASVIAIHHTGKEVGKGTRGSSAIPAGVDHAFEVEADTKARSVQLWTRRHRSSAIPSAPELFQGKVVAGTLVFETLTPDGYRELMGDQDIMSPAKVKAILVGENMREGRIMTTHALAASLRPIKEGETLEDHQLALGRVGVALRKASKGELQLLATYDERSHSVVWTLA